MIIASSPFYTPLFALDRLNSWLRADYGLGTLSQCRLQSMLKRSIYSVKIHAILAASKQMHVGLRRVKAVKPCRVCDATGQYLSPYYMPHYEEGETWDDARSNYGERCHTCAGTGQVNLLFIESIIGPIRWHSPAKDWFSWSLDVYVPFPSFYGELNAADYYAMATDWEPLQKGRPLELAEVKRDLLIVLEAFPHDLCSSLDFYHSAGLERTFKTPDVIKARQWINQLFNRVELI